MISMKVKITEMYEDLTPVKNFLGEEQSRIVEVTPEEYKKMLDEYPLEESYIGDCEIRDGEVERIQYKFEVI